ncbi:hypothetical protein D3C76_808450 [compost metagenome]
MLGDFFLVRQQVVFQGTVRFLGSTARAGAGNRAHGDQVVLDPHQHFRRTADHMEVAEIEEVHVRRRVEAAQGTVQVDGRRLEVDRHALGRHHLHAVTRQDVLLDAANRVFVILAGIAGAELRLGRLRAAQVQAPAWGNRLAQCLQQPCQACLALFESLLLGRVYQHDGVHLAGQVVEHHHGVGHHQQDIRHTQWVRVRACTQTLLHIAHAVITEVADQAAIETWQARDIGDLVTVLERLDEGQRVVDVMALYLDAILQDAHLITMHAHHGARRQADHRVTAPFLPALYRLEQIGVGLISQFQVDRQRRVEVGQGFTGQGDAVVAGSGQAQEFFAVHE